MKKHFTISAVGFGPLVITGNIPPSFSKYHIPGSAVLGAEKPFGKFLLQIIKLNGFSWAYSIFEIESDVSFVINYSAPLTVCHITLAGNAEHDIMALGKFKRKQSQFNILYTPFLQSNFSIKKGHRYISIDLLFPVEFMIQALAFFPAFEKFQDHIRSRTPSIIPHRDIFLNARLLNTIHQLIHSPYSPHVRNFHQNLMRQLLSGLLKEASILYPGRNKFFLHRLENIYEAKEFIDAHLSEHFTIAHISRKIGINEQDLKRGFKEIFGKGLFEYLLTERLMIARIQVEQTFRPIKDIARSAGYKSAGNFSVSFKKKFGKTPICWRKDYKMQNVPA